MNNRVLVVAAHADDEALGCGGTICRHVEAGDWVEVLFLTNGVGSRKDVDAGAVERRSNAMNVALKILGVHNHASYDFPDNALDTVSILAIVKAIASFIEQSKIPNIVYTHHAGDLNIDHQTAHRAVMTYFRPQAHESVPEAIYSFEVPSSTGWFGASGHSSFIPNYFVNITQTIDKKLASLEAYEEEMRAWPHARSLDAVKNLAGYRGSHVGLSAAEAFVVERIIH
jgi:LmbE family N-acetylglucosaminyl deacetylase